MGTAGKGLPAVPFRHPHLGHNALFYKTLTPTSHHGPQRGIWASGLIRQIAWQSVGIGGGFRSFEAIMGSFNPLSFDPMSLNPRQFPRPARSSLATAAVTALALFSFARAVEHPPAPGPGPPRSAAPPAPPDPPPRAPGAPRAP